jgi:cell division protein FtsB
LLDILVENCAASMPKRNYIKRTRTTTRSAWKRRSILVTAVVGGLFFLWSLIVGEMGIVKYYRMKAQDRSLRAEIDHLKQDNVRLLQEIRALKNDSAYLERLARDKIGLARPDEVVYYYGDPVSR